ncbi:hypothetical protein ACQCSX_14940 [Pseudarthrobacter sp. P1]|uniref:hypothetical protein n=1 Tax=Pseudarthrobacter sp. P1 TaxID=3418418 RepID=UPI003CF4F8E4
MSLKIAAVRPVPTPPDAAVLALRAAVLPAAKNPVRLHPRLAAVAAAAGIAAHGAMAFSMASSPPMVALTLLMAAACTPCALSLWRGGGVGPARMLVGMSLAMVLVHGAILLGVFSGALGHSGGHGAMAPLATSAAGAMGAAGSMADATLAVLLCDYLAAMLAATWLFRLGRASRLAAAAA